MTTETVIGGTPIKVPMIDIHTVGAGGGSIAEIDAGGALRVGPRSAGADPGPICYGKGDELTVTDANLFLGRLDANRFLGGRMRLDDKRVVAHLESFASQLRLTPTEAAEGILKVANATMERAIRVISVERGFDARDFVLVSFGGAGGLHACDLARHLAISTVLIPPNGGLLSAYGMLLSDIVKDYSQTVLWKVDDDGEALASDLKDTFAKLVDQGVIEMQSEGVTPNDIVAEQTVDMRYDGQSYELNVPFDCDFIARFHQKHRQRFGYAKSDTPVEVVNLRLRVVGRTTRPEMEPEPLASTHPDEASIDRKAVIFDGDSHDTDFYQRELLRPGNQLPGPAVITELSATTVIPPDFHGAVDAYRNMVLTQT